MKNHTSLIGTRMGYEWNTLFQWCCSTLVMMIMMERGRSAETNQNDFIRQYVVQEGAFFYTNSHGMTFEEEADPLSYAHFKNWRNQPNWRGVLANGMTISSNDLNEILTLHKQYIDGASLQLRANLSNCILTNANLCSNTLAQIIINDANLDGSFLYGANLVGANLGNNILHTQKIC